VQKIVANSFKQSVTDANVISKCA